MDIVFIIITPAIALALDFANWVEACYIRSLLVRDAIEDEWTKAITSYFKFGGVGIRVGLISLLAWVGLFTSRQFGSTAIIFGSLGVALFISYVGVAIWSFSSNLKKFYEE